MSSFSERYHKRHGIGGAIVGVVVIVVIIISALAGYYAAASSISASTSTSISTTTLSPSTVTSTATSTLTNTETEVVTNTVSVSGTVTVTQTGTTQTITNTQTNTVTNTQTNTVTQTTVATPVLPSSLPTPASPITEAGSSLLYPLFETWAPAFQNMYSNVQVSTAAGGSGAGQSGVEAGTLNLGGSDVFLTNAQVQEYPNVLNIPVAVSAQAINYNLPMVTEQLNFTGNVLAGIYNGTIQYWDNAAIKAINPGVASELPHQLIVPLHRSDSSGDTGLFTTYLSDTSSDWAKNYGEGTTISWPSNPAAEAEDGNSGMLTACSQTEYCIAYIGVSYLAQATTDGLGNAKLYNLAGNYVALTTPNVTAALDAQYSSTPANERVSLVDGPGANSYPIVNYEYVMVDQTQPSQTLATDIIALLEWATLPQYGQSSTYLGPVGFVALPNSIAQLSWTQIESITG